LRIDAHHSFSERYPLEHLGTILARNRFEGSILAGPLIDTPEFVRGIIATEWDDLDACVRHPKFRGVLIRGAIPPLDAFESRGIPVDIEGNLTEVPRLAAAHPKLTIVIDQLGAPAHENWAAEIEAAAQFGHVYSVPALAASLCETCAGTLRTRPPDVRQRLAQRSSRVHVEAESGGVYTSHRRAANRGSRTIAGRDGRPCVPAPSRVGVPVRSWLLWRRRVMSKTFGFNEDELKLLLVAVRQMRRTFAQAREKDPDIEAYAQLYDALFEKLRDMAGPLPENVKL
jgi:hypothetical protein